MRAAADRATISPSSRAVGRLVVPGDKSISHRYAILAALADGASVISGYSQGADCRATIDCLRALGIEIDVANDKIVINGRGTRGLRAPGRALDAQNSGTTMRLLSGVVAGQPFRTTLTGDESLRRRPMRRIIEPLERMGAQITADGDRPPLTIDGARLRSISHTLVVPSAQVKSCVLLAGLFADGRTEVVERTPTRDHTERALETFNVRVERFADRVRVAGGQSLKAREVSVPGDLSSAAFWGALAAATPGAQIEIDGVGLNPTRTALLDVLRRVGARISVNVRDESAPEPAGTVTVSFAAVRSFEIPAEEVPGLIDEIPALTALAAMMPPGLDFSVRGARELRVKESDRISSLVAGFRSMGADIEEFEDGFHLRSQPLKGAIVDSAGDHRLAMAFAIAATRASSETTILGAAAVDVSYPGFFETLAHLTHAGR